MIVTKPSTSLTASAALCRILSIGNVPLIAGVGLFLATLPGLAHHSFMSQFDPEKPFAVVGTVTKVEWRNPHALFYIDVEGEDGNVANWSMELLSANQLMRRGWAHDSMKIGDVVSVEGFAARDGSNNGGVSMVTLTTSGKQLLTGQGPGAR